MVLSREDWDQVLCWSSKDAHGWGKFGCRVRRVPVLQDGFLEASMSIAPSFPVLPVIKLLTVLTPTSALQLLRECHRAKSVVNSPIL